MPNGATDGKIGAAMALTGAIGLGLLSRFQFSVPVEVGGFLDIVLLILFAWGMANLLWWANKKLPGLATVALLLGAICAGTLFVANGSFFGSVVCGATAVIAAASLIYRRRPKAD